MRHGKQQIHMSSREPVLTSDGTRGCPCQAPTAQGGYDYNRSSQSDLISFLERWGYFKCSPNPEPSHIQSGGFSLCPGAPKTSSVFPPALPPHLTTMLLASSPP